VIRILSLGAGVQSSTLALMSAVGELPALDGAIFADTQAEPAGVYRHLDWLEGVVPFPIHRVTAGHLGEAIHAAMAGDRRLDARPPFYTGGGGMIRRECSQDFKIVPIQRKLRDITGIGPRSRGPRSVAVEQWIGISWDEAHRMRDARFRWIRNAYPLVDRHLTRRSCLDWLEASGFPRPPKSACTFCPYHDDRYWRDLQREDPAGWAEAVAMDRTIRPGIPGPKRPAGEAWYLHRQLIPLELVDLSTAEDHGQGRLFGDECQGVCGV